MVAIWSLFSAICADDRVVAEEMLLIFALEWCASECTITFFFVMSRNTAGKHLGFRKSLGRSVSYLKVHHEQHLLCHFHLGSRFGKAKFLGGDYNLLIHFVLTAR